jgi:pilus assembly protein Flp/PilA
MSIFKRFAADEHGATAIEYGLIAVLITVGCLGGLQATGTSIDQLWNGGTSPIRNVLTG